MVLSVHTVQGFLEFTARVKVYKMVIRLKHLSDQVKDKPANKKRKRFFTIKL